MGKNPGTFFIGSSNLKNGVGFSSSPGNLNGVIKLLGKYNIDLKGPQSVILICSPVPLIRKILCFLRGGMNIIGRFN